MAGSWLYEEAGHRDPVRSNWPVFAATTIAEIIEYLRKYFNVSG